MLRNLSAAAFFAAAVTLAVGAALYGRQVTAEVAIVRLDPQFDKIIPPDAKLEKIVHGFEWTEGPVWDRTGGYLLFSDVPRNSIFKWKPGEGTSLFLKQSGYTGNEKFTGREPGSNGLAFDAQGRLHICQHGDRHVSRLESDGSRTVVADSHAGKRLNSPNDLVFKSNGDLYFTDPPFGLPKVFDDPARETPYSGVYRVAKDGKITLLTSAITAPNGIAFSPDEKILYVTNPKENKWFAFDVNADGTLTNQRLFFDGSTIAGDKPGGADGLKVDARGNLFAAAPGGLWIISPDGVLLGRFELNAATGNAAWGADGSTLFITASHAVYRIRLNTKGAGW